MDEKHKNKKFNTITDKLKFYATAYNCGFDRTDASIKEFAALKLFPSGKEKDSDNFQYADLAAFFYKRKCSNFCLEKN